MSLYNFYFFLKGTGCARGFLSAMDAGWMIRDWCLGESFLNSNNITRFFRIRMKPKLDHNWSSSYSQAGQNANQGQHSSLGLISTHHAFPHSPPAKLGQEPIRANTLTFVFIGTNYSFSPSCSQAWQDLSRVSTLAFGLIGTNHAFPPSHPDKLGQEPIRVNTQHSNFRFYCYKLRLLSLLQSNWAGSEQGQQSGVRPHWSHPLLQLN